MNDTSRIHARPLWALILGIAVFLSVVWYRNFEIVQISNAQDLTFMKIFRDRDLYPDTFLLKNIHFVLLSSAYYWLVGFLGLFFDPYWTLYACFVLTNAVCLAGIFHLARTVTRDDAAALLAALALSTEWQLGHALGGSGPLGLAPGSLNLATGLLLFAFSFFLQGRRRTAFALAGAVFNLHASLSLFALTMLGTATLLQRRYKDLAVGCVLGAATALPSFVYLLPLSVAREAMPFDQWYRLIRLRSAHHTMPFLFQFHNYVRFLPYPFLFFLGYRMALKERTGEDLTKVRDLLKLAFGVMLLCVIGTVFTEWLPIATVIKLTLFRCTRFFVVFSVILYLAGAVKRLRRNDSSSWTHLILIAGLVSASFPVVYAGLLVLGLAPLWRRNRAVAAAGAASLGLAGIVAGRYALRRYGIDVLWEHTNAHMFLAASALLAAYAATAVRRGTRRPLAPAFLALLALTPLLSPLYPLFQDVGYYDDSKTLQLWLKDHTPRGRLVLYPPDAGIWNGLSERGDSFTFTELAYSIYAPQLGDEVINRATDYVPDLLSFEDSRVLKAEMVKAYGGWDETKFRAMGAKFGSRFAVVRKDKALAFPLRYENATFRVYEIDHEIK